MNALNCSTLGTKFLIFSSDKLYSEAVLVFFFMFFSALVYLMIARAFITKTSYFKYITAIVIVFLAWLFADIVTWANTNPATITLFWASMIGLEAILFGFTAWFIENLSESKRSFGFYYVLAALPLIILWPAKIAILGFDATNCSREAVEGPLAGYLYLYEGILLSIFIVKYIYSYIKGALKKHSLYAFLGSLLLLVPIFVGNIVSIILGTWTTTKYILLPAPLGILLMCAPFLIEGFKSTIKPRVLEFSLHAMGLLYGAFLIIFVRGMDPINAYFWAIVVGFYVIFVISKVILHIKQIQLESKK